MSSRSVLSAVLLLGALAVPAPALAQNTKPIPHGMVKVGDQLKRYIATVTELQNGDRACYVVMKDPAGKEFTELGTFDICGMHLVGKRVTLTYKMEEVMAESCQGNPRCMKKDRVPLIVDAKVMR
jgi:hypothetical protein